MEGTRKVLGTVTEITRKVLLKVIFIEDVYLMDTTLMNSFLGKKVFFQIFLRENI